MVGQGGFSVVCMVEKIELDEVYDVGDKEAKLRADFAAASKDHQYVLKTLRSDLVEEEHVKGVVDLAIEAEFLAVLSHPNIISMRAFANSDPYESRFFVILDRLVMTLDRKFNQWRAEVGLSRGMWFGPFGYCCAKKYQLYETWLERISASRDIANAIYYLHRSSIVYRDLKPDNLGFDVNGTLKLFDFGLAKRLESVDKTPEGMYYLTGNTGSLRYMAPEVALGEPYDQRVDSYSFGILFWQICSLQTPYDGFSTKSHALKVVGQGYRPKIDRSWPVSWSDLMARAWSQDKLSRPDFDEIAVFLDREVSELLDAVGEIPSRSSKKTRKVTYENTTSRRFENNVV